MSERLLVWVHERAEHSLEDAEFAASGVRYELDQLGGWNNPDLGKRSMYSFTSQMRLVKYERFLIYHHSLQKRTPLLERSRSS